MATEKIITFFHVSVGNLDTSLVYIFTTFLGQIHGMSYEARRKKMPNSGEFDDCYAVSPDTNCRLHKDLEDIFLVHDVGVKHIWLFKSWLYITFVPTADAQLCVQQIRFASLIVNTLPTDRPMFL
jgi:hypothetical protein